MSRNNTFTSTIALRGFSSEFSIALDIPSIAALKDDMDEEMNAFLPNMNIRLRFVADGLNLVQERYISAWSDELFDLLDLSLCLGHFAEQSDTTVEIPDTGDHAPYSHRALCAIHQQCLGCELLLYSKSTPRFLDKRFVKILFHLDEDNRNQTTLAYMEASIEAIRSFARDMYDLYEKVDAIRISTVDDMDSIHRATD